MRVHPVVRVVREVHAKHPQHDDRFLPARSPLRDRRVLVRRNCVAGVEKLLARLRDSAAGAFVPRPSSLLALP